MERGGSPTTLLSSRGGVQRQPSVAVALFMKDGIGARIPSLISAYLNLFAYEWTPVLRVVVCSQELITPPL
jgi:hypothetical protein